MKKLLTSVLALLMAAMMVITLASCGGKDEPETTTQAPEVESTEDVNAPAENDTTAEADTSAAEVESTEAPAVEESSAAEDATGEDASSEAAEVVVPTEKADIVALYNEATAYAKSAKPGFKKTVTTELQNLEMGLLGNLEIVRDAVGSFLGEGTETVTVAKGKATDEIVKSTLTASDVTDAKCKLSADGKYYEVTITVKNETNPLKGKSALNKYTNDYKDVNEMHEGLASEDASAETITCTVTTAKIKAKIAVADKSFSALDYTIKTDALLTKVHYKLDVKQAAGTIYTEVTYSKFAY